ncbi:MAG: hypothetical protein GY807_05575 [Gammaproteobacteria bacterium]|nr:hypothetical protein [Gammaproteobacteria bacterium]
MNKKTIMKPLAAALGAAMAASLLSIPAANADENPFGLTKLSSGYMVVAGKEGKCGEGKCGGEKKTEGKCGGDKKGEGKCGGDKKGEGKCGGDKKKEGKCGGDKKKEGKCGEGKCGGKK